MRKSYGYATRRAAQKPSVAIVATLHAIEGQFAIVATREPRKGRTLAQRVASAGDVGVAAARTNAQAVHAALACIAAL